jgi:hypothetical protein
MLMVLSDTEKRRMNVPAATVRIGAAVSGSIFR